MPTDASVLVVDAPRDAAHTAEWLASALDDVGVFTAEDVPTAMKLVRNRPIDCVVSEYEVPDEDGLMLQGGRDLLRRTREHDPALPFVLFTEVASQDVVRSVVAEGITDFIRRDGSPETYDYLASRVESAIDCRRKGRRAQWQHRVAEALRDVNQALVRAETRDAVEHDVCDRLADADLYRFAATATPDGDGVELRASAGDAAPATAVFDPFPPATLADLDSVMVTRRSAADDVGPAVRWPGPASATPVPARPSSSADERRVETVAVVPVVYGDARYGLLVVGTRRRGAFDDTERRVLAELGETIAHAIEAAETRAELEARERELARQNERLQRFASMVSHDLRNPLQVIEGRLSYVEAEVPDEQYRTMQSALDRMSALIRDVLHLATGGANVVDERPVDLETVTREAWASTREAGDLVVERGGPLVADESLLTQLLANLFRNAVEHAGPDVTVRVERLPDGFAVCDDGPGIPASERAQVFELGYSTDGASTGYGLAIVAEIADAHGWDVTLAEDCDTADDCGAYFAFTDVETPE